MVHGSQINPYSSTEEYYGNGSPATGGLLPRLECGNWLECNIDKDKNVIVRTNLSSHPVTQVTQLTQLAQLTHIKYGCGRTKLVTVTKLFCIIHKSIKPSFFPPFRLTNNNHNHNIINSEKCLLGCGSSFPIPLANFKVRELLNKMKIQKNPHPCAKPTLLQILRRVTAIATH